MSVVAGCFVLLLAVVVAAVEVATAVAIAAFVAVAADGATLSKSR